MTQQSTITERYIYMRVFNIIKMGATTFSKCETMVHNLLSHGKDKLLDYELTLALTKNIGSDPRTLKNALALMVATGLIKQVKGGFKLCRIKTT